MTNPYTKFDQLAFWKTAVAEIDPLEIKNLNKPKRAISPDDFVATAGSCFAQHISRRLKSEGFNFLDLEPAPPLLRPEHRTKFGYELFSARYGNIYTSTQLRQLILRMLGKFQPKERVWETNGRFYDPFRPSIEPNGMDSIEEVLSSQDSHLALVRKMFCKADVFVFTLGLTEAWRLKEDGSVYPRVRT